MTLRIKQNGRSPSDCIADVQRGSGTQEKRLQRAVCFSVLECQSTKDQYTDVVDNVTRKIQRKEQSVHSSLSPCSPQTKMLSC